MQCQITTTPIFQIRVMYCDNSMNKSITSIKFHKLDGMERRYRPPLGKVPFLRNYLTNFNKIWWVKLPKHSYHTLWKWNRRTNHVYYLYKINKNFAQIVASRYITKYVDPILHRTVEKNNEFWQVIPRKMV